jgi:hypothetical protein
VEGCHIGWRHSLPSPGIVVPSQPNLERCEQSRADRYFSTCHSQSGLGPCPNYPKFAQNLENFILKKS